MRLLRVGAWVFAALMLTGLGLMFFYVPSAEYLPVADTGQRTISIGGVLRGTHFWTAHVLGPVLLAHLVAVLARRGQARRQRRNLALFALCLLGLTGLLWYTGMLLPWDELSHFMMEFGRARSVHLTLLQIYWLHIALLPIIFAALLLIDIRLFKTTRPLK